MVRKNYPDEFKRDAVALYRDTEGATITAIADEIGVSGVTLSAWCKGRWGADSAPQPHQWCRIGIGRGNS